MEIASECQPYFHVEHTSEYKFDTKQILHTSMV
jgi:hypothetical protein